MKGNHVHVFKNTTRVYRKSLLFIGIEPLHQYGEKAVEYRLTSFPSRRTNSIPSELLGYESDHLGQLPEDMGISIESKQMMQWFVLQLLQQRISEIVKIRRGKLVQISQR